MLPHYRKRTSAVLRAEGERGAFLFQTPSGHPDGEVAVARRPPAAAMGRPCRADRKTEAPKRVSCRRSIQAGVRPLERLAVNGAYALGVYFAITTHDPVYIGALFAFLMLTQRVSGPLLQDGAAHQPV